jgi:hypothetical protein
MLLVVILGSLGTTACDALDPCKKEGEFGISDNTLNLNVLSARRWNLVSVNGAPIPSSGYVVAGFPERLYSGTLEFQTDDWWGNNACSDIFESVGPVIGSYDVHVPAQASALQSAAGRFHALHESKVVTFYAGSESKAGLLSDSRGPGRTLTVPGLKIKKFGDRVFTLVFAERYPF